MFLNLTLIEFNLIVTGYEHTLKNDMMLSWEQTRWLAATSLLPHLGKGKKMKPTDLIKFDWDTKPKQKQKKTKSKQQNIENLKKLTASFNKNFFQKKQKYNGSK